MLKKLLIGAAVLALLLLISVVALVAFFDVNRFKPQIESFVLQNYARTLRIDGDLTLKVWPDIAVALPAMTLSEPKQPGSSAMKLSEARVGVRLMPLLSGRLEADVIRVKGLQASIVRRADGSLSIDDLLGASTPDAAAPSAPGRSGGAGSSSPIALNEITLGGLELLDAQVVFDDRQAKNRIELRDLDLKTGPLSDGAETPLDLGADVVMSNPKLDLRADLQSRLSLALASRQIDASTLDLTIKGRLDGMALNQRIKAGGLLVSEAGVRASNLELTGDIDQGARRIAYTIGSPFSMDLNSGAVALEKLAGSLSLDDPAVGAQTLVVPITGSVRANTVKETANALLDLAAHDMKLQAKVDVKGFATPAITFDVAADRIDVDRFLPPSASSASSAPKAPNAPGAPAPKPDAETPIDLSVLDGLAVDGRLRVGELIASGATLRALEAVVKVDRGRASLAPMTASLYDGMLKANAFASAAGNRIGLAATLTGIQIGPLLMDVAETDLLTGKGDVSIDVRTDGATVSALKRALDGKASLSLADGAIKGINLGERIRDVRQMLKVGKPEQVASNDQVRTDFSALTASFDIVDGVATNTDLDGKTPLLRLDGGGKVDVAAGTIDYLARASVVGTSKGQGGRELNELRGVTIPVRLTGPFETLAWAIDWSEAARQALKSEAAARLGVDEAALEARKAELKARAEAEQARAREQLQARVAEEEVRAREKLKEQERKLKDKAAEKLKGLFN